MTLPKTFTLASSNFDDCEPMSIDEGNSSTNASNIRQNNQQELREEQAQHALNTTNDTHHPQPMASISVTPMLASNVNVDSRVMSHVNRSDALTSGFKPDVLVENVMPGIYLTKDFISWKREQLRAYGFTHIIIIDKHVQELYYPNHQPDIFKLSPTNTTFSERSETDINGCATAVYGGLHDDSTSINAFDYYCPSLVASTATALNFGKDFEVLNLNFGEKSYLTTVLPNCYKAVNFISKALQTGGTILVIDCNGGEQKCLTIIVAFLMYENNISFSNAFARLKEFYKKADLDRFYISQLYEYEPILQVQRAQSRGHSSSRELHAAHLKRKTPNDEDELTCAGSSIFGQGEETTATELLLSNCNPLSRFDTTQMEVRHNYKIANRQPGAAAADQLVGNEATTFTRFMTGTSKTGGWYNWDENAME